MGRFTKSVHILLDQTPEIVGGKKNTLKSVPKPIWQSYITADEPLNSLSDRSENWFMPYLADCGSVEKEFKYARRFVDFCNRTNE